jgi:two-component system NtrC family response regulator
MVDWATRVEGGGEPALVGRSAVFQGLLRRIGQAAKVLRTTLLTGPTGSGKDVIARTLHARSARRDAPFNPVHCAALPEGLVESELFGHQRGAFTGAQSQRAGLIRAAHGGTIFLDEIDSLSLAMQAKLLRFLDTGEFRSVGADRCERSDAWVIAATNQDLEARVRAGAFREDLYFRLAAIRIAVPALRDRAEDVVLLAEHFLARLGGTAALSAEAHAALVGHSWPGNVRELKHRVESAALLHDGPWIDADMLGLGEGHAVCGAPPSSRPGFELEDLLWALVDRDKLSLPGAIVRCERALIRAALRAEENNRTRAAGRLGIHVRTIYKKLDGTADLLEAACPNGHALAGRSQLHDRLDAE